MAAAFQFQHVHHRGAIQSKVYESVESPNAIFWRSMTDTKIIKKTFETQENEF